jgi:hypothetical protein
MEKIFLRMIVNNKLKNTSQEGNSGRKVEVLSVLLMALYSCR